MDDPERGFKVVAHPDLQQTWDACGARLRELGRLVAADGEVSLEDLEAWSLLADRMTIWMIQLRRRTLDHLRSCNPPATRVPPLSPRDLNPTVSEPGAPAPRPRRSPPSPPAPAAPPAAAEAPPAQLGFDDGAPPDAF